MSVISVLVSAVLVLFMFYELSTRKMNPVKYGGTYVLLLLLCAFIPFSNPAGVAGFYLLIALMFRFVYNESNYVSACNTFIVFSVHYISAMTSSALVLMMYRRIVDFREAFRTNHLLYLILFLIISITFIYLVKIMLFKLNDYFEQIKDSQRQLLALNVFLIFLLMLYLRIVIESGVSIAVIQDLKIRVLMILRLIAGVSLFFWLFYTTNRNLIYSSKMNHKSAKMLDRILNKARLGKMSLSVIYIEAPGLEQIIKSKGAKEGRKVVSVIRNIVREVTPNAYTLEVRRSSLLVVVENEDFARVSRQSEILDEMLHSKVMIGRSGEKCFIVGATEYNPVTHDNPQTLIISAQEAAYSR